VHTAISGSVSPKILPYSLHNKILLAAQAEDRGITLRDVDTFHGWKHRGRQVCKGKRGLRIVRPIVYDHESTKDENPAWRMPQPLVFTRALSSRRNLCTQIECAGYHLRRPSPTHEPATQPLTVDHEGRVVYADPHTSPTDQATLTDLAAITAHIFTRHHTSNQTPDHASRSQT
jgi:hypothetical protein